MGQSVSIRAWAVMSAHAHCPHPFIGRDSQKWPDMKHLPEFSDLSLQKILDEAQINWCPLTFQFLYVAHCTDMCPKWPVTTK